jgi:23S rRNA (uracil1939-C5)-methyltransferase
LTALPTRRIPPGVERVVRIESLVHGGAGLARDEGRVLFVPLTVPGDLVQVRIEPERRGTFHAQLLEVLEPGASRIEPPCPVVGRCGGCQWQQVALPAQQQAKEQSVRDVLTRIGGFAAPLPMQPLVPSPKPWRYRRRLRAQLTPTGWGFSQRASHAVEPIAACLLVEAEAESLAHAVAGQLIHDKVWNGVQSFSVDTVAASGSARFKGALHLALAQAPAEAHRKRGLKLLDATPHLAGIVITGPEGAPPMLLGEPVLVDREHRRLRIRPDLFAQANRLGARLLADATAATIEPGACVLELFCGSGTLSLALVERAGSLVATEGDGPALDLLRASLRDQKQTARLIAGPAARVVDGIAREQTTFDHVVLDPPRTGAKDVIPALVRLNPRRITYVSCDAPTFARDAAQLVRGGWALASLTPFDMFPHTHHVELLAVFERS